MKTLFLSAALLCLFPMFLLAQPAFQDSVAAARMKLHKRNMLILGSWAGANIIQGSIAAGNTQGSDHYFYEMNAIWNTFNLALAGIGLRDISRRSGKPLSATANLAEQHKLEKLLVFNTGLDLAYIMTGFYLKEKGNDRSVGYGNSLLLQGGFLLLFDIIQYTGHRRNGKLLEQEPGHWQFGPTRNGAGFTYRLP